MNPFMNQDYDDPNNDPHFDPRYVPGIQRARREAETLKMRREGLKITENIQRAARKRLDKKYNVLIKKGSEKLQPVDANILRRRSLALLNTIHEDAAAAHKQILDAQKLYQDLGHDMNDTDLKLEGAIKEAFLNRENLKAALKAAKNDPESLDELAIEGRLEEIEDYLDHLYNSRRDVDRLAKSETASIKKKIEEGQKRLNNLDRKARVLSASSYPDFVDREIEYVQASVPTRFKNLPLSMQGPLPKEFSNRAPIKISKEVKQKSAEVKLKQKIENVVTPAQAQLIESMRQKIIDDQNAAEQVAVDASKSLEKIQNIAQLPSGRAPDTTIVNEIEILERRIEHEELGRKSTESPLETLLTYPGAGVFKDLDDESSEDTIYFRTSGTPGAPNYYLSEVSDYEDSSSESQLGTLLKHPHTYESSKNIYYEPSKYINYKALPVINNESSSSGPIFAPHVPYKGKTDMELIKETITGPYGRLNKSLKALPGRSKMKYDKINKWLYDTFNIPIPSTQTLIPPSEFDDETPTSYVSNKNDVKLFDYLGNKITPITDSITDFSWIKRLKDYLINNALYTGLDAANYTNKAVSSVADSLRPLVPHTIDTVSGISRQIAPFASKLWNGAKDLIEKEGPGIAKSLIIAALLAIGTAGAKKAFEYVFPNAFEYVYPSKSQEIIHKHILPIQPSKLSDVDMKLLFELLKKPEKPGVDYSMYVKDKIDNLLKIKIKQNWDWEGYERNRLVPSTRYGY